MTQVNRWVLFMSNNLCLSFYVGACFEASVEKCRVCKLILINFEYLQKYRLDLLWKKNNSDV